MNASRKSSNIGTKTPCHRTAALCIFRTTQHVVIAGCASRIENNTAPSGAKRTKTRNPLYQILLPSVSKSLRITKICQRQKPLETASACLWSHKIDTVSGYGLTPLILKLLLRLWLVSFAFYHHNTDLSGFIRMGRKNLN